LAGAATDAGVENSQPGRAPSNKARNTALAVFAMLVVVLALGAAVRAQFMAAPRAEPTLASGSEAALPASAAASSVHVVSVASAAVPSELLPLSDALPPASAAPPTLPRAKPETTPRVAGAASATPSVGKSKPTKTRAGNVGLAEENPF
jgi:hypothetical protein